jgi:hypothetical protein
MNCASTSPPRVTRNPRNGGRTDDRTHPYGRPGGALRCVACCR